jgi:hypothetical protein
VHRGKKVAEHYLTVTHKVSNLFKITDEIRTSYNGILIFRLLDIKQDDRF